MQTVIVYNNPLAAAIWESGFLGYIVVWTFLVVGIILAQEAMFEKFIPRWVRQKYYWYIYGVILESMILAHFIIKFFLG